MTDGHTASKQATALSTLLENIRQRTKKTIRFQTVSADNASSFKPKVLAQELAKGSTSTVQPIYHIRCLAHIFNLVVRAIFEALRISMVEASTEFEPSTTRAKDQEDSDDDFDTEDSTAGENPFGAVIQKRYLKVSDDLTKISITATGDAPSPPPYEVSVEEEDISDRDEELPSLSSSQQPKLSSQVSQLSNSPTPSVSQELPNFSELGGRKKKRLTRLDLVELSPDEDSD
nr:uncharacterized protein CTRU02_14930 [Colletotrichum truncatum]KAF6781632.1 hypothetical protein CTRU02_14930 [Colletotrichum truncatum]